MLSGKSLETMNHRIESIKYSRENIEKEREEERLKVAREINRLQELADQQRTAKKSWGEKISSLAKSVTSTVGGFLKKYPSPVSLAKDKYARDVMRGTIGELPEAARDVFVRKPSEFFFRPTARFGASATLSSARKLGLTKDKEISVQPERSFFEKHIAKPIFGEEPIKSLGVEGKEILGGFGVGEEKAGQFGVATSMALGSLDFIPGGGKFTQKLVKANTVATVKKILGKSASQYSDNVIKSIAKATNKTEIDNIIKRSGEGVDEAMLAFQHSPYKNKIKSVQKSLGRELDISEIRQLEDMSARNVGVDDFRKLFKSFAKKTKTLKKEDLSRKSLTLSVKEFETKADFLKAQPDKVLKKAKPGELAKIYDEGKKLTPKREIALLKETNKITKTQDKFLKRIIEPTSLKKTKKGIKPKTLEPLAKEAKKYKSAEEFVGGESIFPEAGTRNQYYQKNPYRKNLDIIKNKLKDNKQLTQSDRLTIKNGNIWELEQVLKDKPAYLNDGLSEKFLKDFAKKHNLVFKDNIVAKNEKALNRVIDSFKNKKDKGRSLGLALGYEDIGIKTKSQLTDIYNKAIKSDESIVAKYRQAIKNFDEIEVMGGKKLKDTLKISYGRDGYVAAAVTKQDISKIKNAYKGKISDRWIKPRSVKGVKETMKLPARIYELPQILFKRTGLQKYIYDPIRNIGERNAKKQYTELTNRFKKAKLFKEGGWVTADRFDLSKESSEKIGKYYLTRQGKNFNILYKDLAKKEKKFVDIFDKIIKDLEPQFRKVAKLNNKIVKRVTNYAPISTSKDLKLMDREGAMDFMFKHPSFSSLKGRKKFVPKEMYELDYRNVAAKWLDGITKFNNIGEISPQIKLLVESKDFEKVVGSDMANVSKNWLKSVLNPKVPEGLAGKVGFASAKFLRKTSAIAALGLNYAPIIKQVLTQIPLTICEKAPPKLRSKFAKSFGIKVSELPSITERKGAIAIADMQGKLGKIFTGGLTQFDKKNAQYSLNRLLDKNWKKYLKAENLKKGDELSNETKDLIIQKSQDTLDLWYGGMTKAQLPPVFRSEIGKLLNMFIYPLTSQLNGFYYHQLKSKGVIKNVKAAAEIAAAATGIAYMEQVVSNLSPNWNNKEEMTKDVLSSVAGNVPMISQVVYAIDAEQPLQVSPGVSGFSAFFKEFGKEDKDAKTLTLKGAEILGLPKQVRKTTEGAKILEEGGIRSKQEKLLAPVEGKMEKARALLRGKYGALEAKKYVENVGKKVERPIFDKGLEMIESGDHKAVQEYVDNLSDEDYEEYKKGKTSYKRDNTIRVDGLLEYAPKEAIEYVRSLPEVEAQRVVDNLDDEQWEIYKNNM